MVSASSPTWPIGIVQCQSYGLSYAKIGILVDNLLLLVNVFSKGSEKLLHSPHGHGVAVGVRQCPCRCRVTGVLRRAAFELCACSVCATHLAQMARVMKHALLPFKSRVFGGFGALSQNSKYIIKVNGWHVLIAKHCLLL